MNSIVFKDSQLTSTELSEFRANGFIIKNVLTTKEVEEYKSVVLEALTNYGLRNTPMTNLQFLQPNTSILNLQKIVTNSQINSICKSIFNGGDNVIDNAVLFYAGGGNDYKQGWHRDVMQLSDDEIDPKWFTEEHFHNNVQINLPLVEDHCLWVVRGSHKRQLTLEEQALFNGSKMAPVDIENFPGGERVVLQPGQAVFYNNNIIHRGYGPFLDNDRITIQMGFHSNKFQPTYHFAVLNYTEYTDEYLETLDDKVRNSLLLHISERKNHPELMRFHTSHKQFIKQNFTVDALKSA